MPCIPFQIYTFGLVTVVLSNHRSRLPPSDSSLKPFAGTEWDGRRDIRQYYGEKELVDWSFNRIGKYHQPVLDRRGPQFLRFQCADLNAVKDCHEIRSNLGDPFLGHGLRLIVLATTLIDLVCRTRESLC